MNRRAAVRRKKSARRTRLHECRYAHNDICAQKQILSVRERISQYVHSDRLCFGFLFHRNCPDEFVGREGVKFEHIALGGEVVDDAVVGGDAGPRLDCDERGFRLRGVPYRQVFHSVGGFHGDAVFALVGAERNLSRRVFEQDGVAVEQRVPEGQNSVVDKREVVGAFGGVAGVRHINCARPAFGREFEIPVVERAVAAEGHVETRVTAEGERHCDVGVIDDRNFHFHRFADEGIADVVFEIERIHRSRSVVGFDAEIYFVAGEHGGVENAFPHETVQVHFISFAAVGVFAVGQSSANREKVVSAPRPESGVALPQEFRAVGFRANGHKFRADVGYGDFEKFVEYGVNHTPSLSCLLCT